MDPDGSPDTDLSFEWKVDDPVACSFDDGTPEDDGSPSSTLENPTLTCNTAGEYVVTLTVSDGVDESVPDPAIVTMNTIEDVINALKTTILEMDSETGYFTDLRKQQLTYYLDKAIEYLHVEQYRYQVSWRIAINIRTVNAMYNNGVLTQE